jgi:hypothetical protein
VRAGDEEGKKYMESPGEICLRQDNLGDVRLQIILALKVKKIVIVP